jgi:hypothetical protein
MLLCIGIWLHVRVCQTRRAEGVASEETVGIYQFFSFFRALQYFVYFFFCFVSAWLRFFSRPWNVALQRSILKAPWQSWTKKLGENEMNNLQGWSMGSNTNEKVQQQVQNVWSISFCLLGFFLLFFRVLFFIELCNLHLPCDCLRFG